MLNTNLNQNFVPFGNFAYDNNPANFLTKNDPDCYYQYQVNYDQVFVSPEFRRNVWRHNPRFSMTNLAFNTPVNGRRLNSSLYHGRVMAMAKHCPVNASSREWEVFYGQERARYMQNRGIQHEPYIFANMIYDYIQSVQNVKHVQISWREAMLDIFIYVIDNSWMGRHSEIKGIKDMYKYFYRRTNKLVKIEHSAPKDDNGRSIDALVSLSYDNGRSFQLVAGVQLKPATYFASNKEWSDITRNDNLKNNIKFYNEHHVPVLYWTYDDVARDLDPQMLIDVNGGIHKDFHRVPFNA